LLSSTPFFWTAQFFVGTTRPKSSRNTPSRWLLFLPLLLSLSPLLDAQTVKYDLAFRHWGQFYAPWQDWRWWRSQGVAESGLCQEHRSPAGAIGIMQLMPETAKGLGINPGDAEQNIQGGIKYDAQLWSLWRSVTASADRLALVFGSYNAGPGNIQRAAKEAGSTHWPAVAARLAAVTGKRARETVAYIQHIQGFYASGAK